MWFLNYGLLQKDVYFQICYWKHQLIVGVIFTVLIFFIIKQPEGDHAYSILRRNSFRYKHKYMPQIIKTYSTRLDSNTLKRWFGVTIIQILSLGVSIDHDVMEVCSLESEPQREREKFITDTIENSE